MTTRPCPHRPGTGTGSAVLAARAIARDRPSTTAWPTALERAPAPPVRWRAGFRRLPGRTTT
ncbi:MULTISPECIES: hypothetical protein [unclassified Pseudonocardia]|uniref:hypothetical protein n=1 Tax=unclassified Pseudonocardia TaxID=2619320 RepID=UPI000962CE9B|nr:MULTISPECIES: hypothetical protein [unclassified Pseudonocardia]MBN9096736.1 hypothetical protein [Pseudonocardia sp.]OJY51880.1 MAG: hypothetical protein BGP03_27980 [Pseudonocardia sp. 73-21]